ncbi:MAG: flagellar protein FliS [Planctomycetota bacterium]|jgi:flagellar protein FliS
MKNTNVADAYRVAQFESASPVKIVQMLNAGAIRYLKVALTCDPSDSAYRENIRKAEDIIGELRASLDHDPNPEMSGRLEGLYVYMNGELSRAVMEHDMVGIESSVKILETLLDAWTKASKVIGDDSQPATQASVKHVS